MTRPTIVEDKVATSIDGRRRVVVGLDPAITDQSGCLALTEVPDFMETERVWIPTWW
jgi:hypothetical protein